MDFDNTYINSLSHCNNPHQSPPHHHIPPSLNGMQLLISNSRSAHSPYVPIAIGKLPTTMKTFFIFFTLLLLSLLKETKAAATQKNEVYIVYMGAAASSNNSSRNDHVMLLSSVLQRNENAVVHNYKKSFTGFAARLSEEEARSMSQQPGVVSVFRDPILKLQTTHSWDFLDYQPLLNPKYGSVRPGRPPWNLPASDINSIIGIIDTGIWPESMSFDDYGVGPIPKKWKGRCMEGYGFNSSHCNRKIIGARYYEEDTEEPPEGASPRDQVGHGTHVASTAAGNIVPGASFYGQAQGNARGGSPWSRIAVYKACYPDGCTGSAILAAFDDAISDGVDVLSLSVGGDPMNPMDFIEDPIAIGGFHAAEKGILVVCSGGNEGPTEQSVVNVAPWLLTVAATTIDRTFQSNVVLGNHKVVKGKGIHFGNFRISPVYPLIFGGSAKLSSSEDDFSARECNKDALDANKIAGKIVVCQNDMNLYSPEEKLDGLISNGGIGMILIDDDSPEMPSTTVSSEPMTVINSNDAATILSYINSNRNPVATILRTVTVIGSTPAPQVAFFSSRGPQTLMRNILKPDIAAPGVDILAAWMGNDDTAAPEGMDPPLYNIVSGTSMACPHVAGVAGVVKGLRPTWSASAIRSAIMTTASQINNMQEPITSDNRTIVIDPGRGSVATPYDIGSGELTTLRTLEAGLVYETDTLDYLILLCNYGYDESTIKIMSTFLPPGFSCPKNSNEGLISNMNYPSISISEFDGTGKKKVTRTVTNVGSNDNAVYTAIVDAPAGLNVKVKPDKLMFTNRVKKLSYDVIITSTSFSKPEKDMFGSITWTNGRYKVRSPFVVSSRPSKGH